jgi:hypothetical protein
VILQLQASYEIAGGLQHDPCILGLAGKVDRFGYQKVRQEARKYLPRLRAQPFVFWTG